MLDKNKRTVNISIVAANYNNGKYLDDFIQSIDKSSVLPEELIIIDDGSSDNSIEVLRKYRNLNYLKIIQFAANRGFTEALNTGVISAKGKYIMRADPDDIFLSNRIEMQFEYMENNTSVDVLGSNVIYFKGDPEKVINVSNFPLTFLGIYKKYTKGEHGVQHPTIIVKSEILKKYRYGKIFPGEDYELFARMIKDGHVFANLKTPLYKMRVHASSSTSNLSYEGIRQTFSYRDDIFGLKTSKFRMLMYYSYIKNYRKYQMADKSIKSLFYLLISSLSYPQKLIDRLISAEGILRYNK